MLVEKKHSAKYFKEVLVQRHFFLLCVQWEGREGWGSGSRDQGSERGKGKRQNAKKAEGSRGGEGAGKGKGNKGN